MDYAYIDGRFLSEAGDRKLIDIFNPSSGEKIVSIPSCNRIDVSNAIDSARAAFEGPYGQYLPSQRAEILLLIASIIEENAKELALIEAEDTGKPYKAEMLDAEIPLIIDNLKYFAGICRSNSGLHAGTFYENHTSYFTKHPVGVVAHIIPWNYPLMVACWKIGVTIAAGCTCILKPAPETPLSLFKLMSLISVDQIPSGVVNVIYGDDDTGKILSSSSGVNMLCLTGSYEAGKDVAKNASNNIVRTHLELGGNAPMIISNTIDDISGVAATVAFATTVNTGQDCVAGTRVIINNDIYDEFKRALCLELQNISIGKFDDENATVGPLISKAHYDKVTSYLEKSKKVGLNVIELKHNNLPEKGFFISPYIVEDHSGNSLVFKDEVFGPVLTLSRYDEFSKAIALANNVEQGLSASVFTNDLEEAMAASINIDVGTIWINNHLIFVSEGPHGGAKKSGFGKDLSLESIAELQYTRHIMINRSKV